MKTLFELIYKYKYFDLDLVLSDIKKVSALDKTEFEEWQINRFWEITKHHYSKNVFYKSKIGKSLPTNISELPIITKEDLQSNIDNLITKGYNKNDIYINNTSGSSGHPLTFAKDYYTQARVWAYKKKFSNMHGIDYFSSKEAKFYGMPKTKFAYMIQKLKDLILNRERFVVFEQNDGVYKEWLKRFKNKKFDYIYGYTSSIVLFSRFLIKNNIVLNEICPTLKIVIVTSESCSKEDKEIIRKATGVESRNEYGAADAGLIGYECSNGHLHICGENIYLETNEDNEVLITDLFNKAFPLIRYKVGDIAILSSENCPCGTNNLIIKELQGRTNDFAKLKSGKIVPGLTFYYISRALLESSGVLKEFIIRQTSLTRFEFDVVSDDKLNNNDIVKLKKTAEEFLEPGLEIIVNEVEKINRPSSGKIKHFYSEIKDS